MTDLHFRAARLADLDAIVDLVTSAYRGDASRAGWTTEADFLDGNRIDARGAARLTSRTPQSRVLLARHATGEMLACAHVSHRRRRRRLLRHVLGRATACRAAGIGKRRCWPKANASCAKTCELARSMRMTVIDIRDEPDRLLRTARISCAPA
jgi:hypothetical protein